MAESGGTEGRIVEVLGHKDERDGYPVHYTPVQPAGNLFEETLNLVKKIPQRCPGGDIQEDLRDLKTFTMDGADASVWMMPSP